MTSVSDAGGGVELRISRKLAGLHAGHRRHSLPGAAGVISIHRPAEQRLFRIGKQCVVLLLGGDELGEEIGIECGLAGQSKKGAIAGIHRDDRTTRLVGQSLLRCLL